MCLLSCVVRVTGGKNGQEKFSSSIYIEGYRSDALKVWANENGNKIYISGITTGNNIAKLMIYSSSGQNVLTKNITAGMETITVNNLSKGIYHYQLYFEGKMISGKLLLGGNN